MIQIREATLDDLDNIASLHALSWQQNYHPVLSKDYLDNQVEKDRYQVWQQRLHSPASNQRVLVAELTHKEKTNDFCGFICLYGNHHSKYGTIIDNLHVKPEMKGLGIGTKLIARGAKWANDNYAESGLYLEVLEINRKAIRFYSHLGGEQADITYWQTPCNNKVKEYIYSWQSPDLLVNVSD